MGSGDLVPRELGFRLGLGEGVGSGGWVRRVGVPDCDTTLPTLARSPELSLISPHTSPHPHLFSHCPHLNTLSTPLPTPQTHFPTPTPHPLHLPILFRTPTHFPPLPTPPTHLPTPPLTSPHTPTHFPTPSLFPPYLTQLPIISPFLTIHTPPFFPISAFMPNSPISHLRSANCM